MGGLGVWVAPGHLAIQPKAEGAGEAKEGDLTAGDLARPPGKLDCWNEDIQEADANNPA